MTTGFGFISLKKSITKVCEDMRKSILDDGYEKGLTYVSFDNHADDETLPPGDIIGTGGYSFVNDSQMQTVYCNFGIGTEDDAHLYRHDQILDYMYQRLLPETKYNVFGSEDALPIGSMVVDQVVTITPMLRTSVRSLQYIELMFKTDLITLSPDVFPG